MNKARSIKKWYDRTAKSYDESTNKNIYYLKEVEGVKKLLSIKKGDITLDIATGTGTYLIILARSGAICYGVDISPAMLKEAKTKVKKLKLKNVKELKIADAINLPYDNEFFDWVTCIGMFEYFQVSHAKKILREMRRVLKDNGRAIVDFPRTNYKLGENYSITKSVNGAKILTGKQSGVKVYLYKPKLIEQAIKHCGFEILKKNTVEVEVQFLLSKRCI